MTQSDGHLEALIGHRNGCPHLHFEQGPCTCKRGQESNGGTMTHVFMEATLTASAGPMRPDAVCGVCDRRYDHPVHVLVDGTPTSNAWTQKPRACTLIVCAECGATSNRMSFGSEAHKRLWSAAGRCHLTPGDESNWVPYAPSRDLAEAVRLANKHPRDWDSEDVESLVRLNAIVEPSKLGSLSPDPSVRPEIWVRAVGETP